MHPANLTASASWFAPALFGRDAELDHLRACLRATCAGHGSLVLISGEAGIGKTTLTAVICHEAAEAGALVLGGGSYDHTSTPPYGPWVEIARVYPDDDSLPPMPGQLREGGGMEGIDSQAALFESTGRFLASLAAQRPLVLRLEDLHWSDAGSLELLRYVSRTLAAHRILLLATYRDDELGREHPLSLLLPALVREGQVNRLRLPRLDTEAVLALVRERYLLSPANEDWLVSYLWRLSEGNPFFTKELLYTLEEQRLLYPADGAWALGDLANVLVPTLVQQVTAERLARLEPASRRLLEMAAVIGHAAPLDIFRELFGDAVEELDAALQQAIRRHVLNVQPDHRSVRFSHALVRQAIYEAIPLLSRQALHRRVGELFAGRGGVDPATVANHLEEAGDDRALEWWLRAAGEARALFAPQTVIDTCGRAVTLAAQDGLDVSPDVYSLRGWAHDAAGDFSAAVSDYERALVLARRSADRLDEWHSLLDLSAIWASRDYQRAGDYCRQAVELSRSIDDPTALGHSLNRQGNWHLNAGRPSEASHLHLEALDIFKGIDDRRGLANTLDLLGLVSAIIGEVPRGLRYFQQAIVLLRELDDRQTLSSALTNVTNAALGTWSHRTTGYAAMPDALGSPMGPVQEAIQITRDIGWRAGEAYALCTLGIVKVSHGELQTGFRLLSEALSIAESIHHRQWITAVHLNFGAAYLDLALLEHARSHLGQALDLATTIGSTFLASLTAGLLASVHIQNGDYAAAERLLHGRIDTESPPTMISERLCWITQAELLLALGQPRRALELLDGALLSLSPPRDSLPAEWSRLRADAMLTLGHTADAEASLHDALRATKTYRLPLVRWRTHTSFARLYLATGRRRAAYTSRDAALATVDDLAGQLDDDMIREAFRHNAIMAIDRSSQPSAMIASPYSRLTRRELEILHHLAAGRSDREIAALLSVSHRTVGNHVSNILGKLDVPSRTAAATLAIREGLVQP